ncbi:MAG: PhoX family protein, partial [Pirellulaceae bacterium]
MDRPLRTTLEEIIEARTTRREVVKGIMAAGGAMTAVWCLPNTAASAMVSTAAGPVANEAGLAGLPVFPHVHQSGDPASVADAEVVEGYRTQVLIKWGDPVVAGAEPMDVHNPTAEGQATQFGYNNDFVAFLPIDRGSNDSRHGLLCVNNEYTHPELMFSRITRSNKMETRTDEHIRIEAAAHGHSIIEIRQDDDAHWHVVSDSPLNRRITLNTRIEINGPARGHSRMKTDADPRGREAFGTLSNCSGGVTPWGTVLSGEENFHFYFRGELTDEREAENHKRYGVIGRGDYSFNRIDDRFDLATTPREPNRFGWVVEIDPYDPESVPVKRTALGRFKHEGAATSLNYDGRVVVYTGDDEINEYLYKFVSEGKYDPHNLENNRGLLDKGTLYVARFGEDGIVQWLPLVHDHGPLTWKNRFHSQADVLIETRRAADYLGATPMDRPEDVEENPVTHNVFVVLTNNSRRSQIRVDAANPRAKNRHGHIIELEIPQVDGKPDHASLSHAWNIFLKAGRLEEDDAWYGGHRPDTWLSCPDNIAFDNQGRLWIA